MPSDGATRVNDVLNGGAFAGTALTGCCLRRARRTLSLETKEAGHEDTRCLVGLPLAKFEPVSSIPFSSIPFRHIRGMRLSS
jgi:hypothetical protein